MDFRLIFNKTRIFQKNYTCGDSLNVTCLSVLLCLFYGCSSVVITCGNLCVIMSIFNFKQLHTPTNYLILSLAVADLLVGILVCPLNIALSETSCWYLGSLLCRIRSSFDMVLCNSSILHLCCISVDRYSVIVCHPLSYTTKINVQVAIIMSLLSWSVSLVIGIGVLVVGSHKYKCVENCSDDLRITTTLGCIVSFYLPASVMLCTYLKIFQVAQKQAQSIHNTTCQSTKSGATVSKMERKATKTLAVIMGVFLMCWTPYFLCLNVQPLSNFAIPDSVMDTFSILGRSNSMINPFIYAFFYSWFRAAFRMIITGKIYQHDLSNSKLY